MGCLGDLIFGIFQLLKLILFITVAFMLAQWIGEISSFSLVKCYVAGTLITFFVAVILP